MTTHSHGYLNSIRTTDCLIKVNENHDKIHEEKVETTSHTYIQRRKKLVSSSESNYRGENCVE